MTLSEEEFSTNQQGEARNKEIKQERLKHAFA
jgi:hypothetical protein